MLSAGSLGANKAKAGVRAQRRVTFQTICTLIPQRGRNSSNPRAGSSTEDIRAIITRGIIMQKYCSFHKLHLFTKHNCFITFRVSDKIFDITKTQCWSTSDSVKSGGQWTATSLNYAQAEKETKMKTRHFLLCPANRSWICSSTV